MAGGCRVEGRETPFVESAAQMIGRFQGELIARLPEWKQRLAGQPAELPEIEREVHQACTRGADLLVVGLLSQRLQQDAFTESCEPVRQAAAVPLAPGRWREVRVRLLGGLVMWVTSLYCQARQRAEEQDESIPGLSPGLAQWGISGGCTPALTSRVARQAVLCPSLRFATDELAREGVSLNEKTVRRIAVGCGKDLLRLRSVQLHQWREGTLPAGRELRGQRVCVQIDGGRMKIRGELQPAESSTERVDELGLPLEDAPGRSRPKPRRRYQAEWREPKLLTIFIHNENGRMVKHSQATLDGTLLGPDATAELVAMHLHRLGAAQAQSVTFAADGAVWIRDRIPAICRLAKIEHVSTYEVLDCHHAVHHISLALKSLGLNDAARLPLYREQRTLLRNGQWRRVVEELRDLASDQPQDAAVWTEIACLEKHGNADRLSYPHFRSLGLPLGSGAIESSIRRVINLRLKGNAMFWRESTAEAMLQLRAQVVSGRWDERLRSVRAHRQSDPRRTWRWSPPDLSRKSEPDSTTPA